MPLWTTQTEQTYRRIVLDARTQPERAKGGILMSSTLLVYGANGYVGEHVARTAGRLGVKAIVAAIIYVIRSRALLAPRLTTTPMLPFERKASPTA